MFVSCVRERDKGKTSFLVELLQENPDALMIVMNGEMKRRALHMIGQRAQNYEHRIITLDNLDVLRGRQPGPLLIDDLDSFLFNYFQRYHRPTEIVATATGKSI